MKRELTVAVAGTAILVAGISGCSSNKPSTSSGTTSRASATSAASGTPSAAAGTTSAAAGAPSWNVTVNGEALSKGAAASDVACGDPTDDPIHIMVGQGTGDYVDLTNGSLQVEAVSLHDDAGNSYLMDPDQVKYHYGGGNAQATHSGKTYKVTGNIAPYMTVQGQILEDATPVPFTFEATCP